MRFEDQDARRAHMLTDPMHKLIPSLALPSIAAMLSGAVYNMADTFFVGKLGNSATGAVGIVFPVSSLLQALAFVFAHGATSRISRALGRNETEEASRTATAALFYALLLGLIYGACGLIWLTPILRLFGATETILPYAKAYAPYIFIASPLVAGTYVLNNTLRAEGSSSLALVGISSGALLNIILDPLFIFPLGMGVAGAGLATMIGQILSFVLLLSFYIKKKGAHSALSIRLSLFKPAWSMFASLITIGLPSFFRQGLSSLASILLNNMAKTYGDAAIASISVVNRVTWLVFAALVGFGQGFQPVCGFNQGAERADRVWDALRFTLITAIAFSLAAGAVLISGAPWFIAIFRNDPEVIEIGTRMLRAQSLTIALQAVVTICTMYFQTSGRPLPALLFAMSRQGFCFVPLVFLLPYYFGLRGLAFTQAGADLLAFLIMLPFTINALRKARDTARQSAT